MYSVEVSGGKDDGCHLAEPMMKIWISVGGVKK
jgi:hypothetical protein